MEGNSPISFLQIQMRDYEEYILASNTSVMHRETGDWDESNYYARVRNVNVNFLYKSMRVVILCVHRRLNSLGNGKVGAVVSGVTEN